MKEIKFCTIESINGESYKQHAFKPYGYNKECIGHDILYENAALCNANIALGDEEGDRMDFSLIENEPLDEKNVCKKCLNIYRNMINSKQDENTRKN